MSLPVTIPRIPIKQSITSIDPCPPPLEFASRLTATQSNARFGGQVYVIHLDRNRAGNISLVMSLLKSKSFRPEEFLRDARPSNLQALKLLPGMKAFSSLPQENTLISKNNILHSS